MSDIIERSRSAWNQVRSEHQPVYDDLVESYQEMLHARAENVVTLRRVGEEGGIFQQFEQVVLEELVPERFHEPNPEPIPVEVKEELIEEAIEEAEHLEPKGPLPKDFPAHDKLHDAGINTYGQLCKVEDLTKIDGIGPAGAKAIKKQLKKDEKALNK